MKTLTLSGWTQPTDALKRALKGDFEVFDYSEHLIPEATYEALAEFSGMPVIGWSMGGQLALRAMASGLYKPSHVTLLSTPWRFVGEEGMGLRTFELFRENYAKDPAHTKEKFHGLVASGDLHQKRILRELTHHPEVENTKRWLPWLDDLGRTALTPIADMPPTLIIHGRGDVIVPHAQARKLYGMLPGAKLSVWKDAGHAPHMHDSERLMEEILEHQKTHGLS